MSSIIRPRTKPRKVKKYNTKVKKVIHKLEHFQCCLYLATKRKFTADDIQRKPCHTASACKYGNFVSASFETAPSDDSTDILSMDLEKEVIKGILDFEQA